MQVKVSDIKKTDNYKGLPSALATEVDTALDAIAAAFAKNKTDGTAFQDNVCMLFKEATTQQVIS